MIDIALEAPAKVNLWLRVLEPDESGYHPLETLFCALDLSDGLEVRTDVDALTLSVEGASLGPPERNLAYRAAAAFFDAAGLPRRASIRLVKRIPHRAGLGGGSSDAATVLRALAKLHPGAVDDAALREIAAGLGSDVPFFLSDAPLALGSGRGERVEPLPALPPRPVLVVAPIEGMDTASAYRALDSLRDRTGAGPAPGPEGLFTTAPLDWGDVAERSVNDFEESVFSEHPSLAELRDILEHAGAAPARLAGSGTAVFGVFAEAAAREEAAEDVQWRFPDARLFRTRTVADAGEADAAAGVEAAPVAG